MKPQITYAGNVLFLTTVFLSIPFLSFSQTIIGVVSDSIGQPLPGATVEIKGTLIRTSTNTDGAYSITGRKPLSTKDVIVFSFTGLKNTEVSYAGNSNINVQLQSAQTVLNEVIVTALGIRREEKSLGYAAQTVSENAVKDARTNNWVNSLSGKLD